MKSKESEERICFALFFAALVFIEPACQSALSRGGFGGGFGGGFRGGGGGAYRGGDFGGFGGERDFGGRAEFGARDGGEMRSDSFRDFDRGFDHPFGDDANNPDRPTAFSGPARDERQDSFDNGVRNYGQQRNLASDGGFNNLSRGAAASVPAARVPAARVPAARVTPANRSTRYISSTTLAGTGRAVRGSFNNYSTFNRSWWANHTNAWWRRNWDDWWPWRYYGWNDMALWWGIPLTAYPAYYDYGDNIYYDDYGYVDYGGDPVCTAADYYQQACTLAASGGSGSDDDFGASAGGEITSPPAPPAGQNSPGAPAAAVSAAAPTAKAGKGAKASKEAVDGDWKPFGVYSLVQGGQTDSNVLFQICSNKKGQIRGNYYNCLTSEVQPITGAMDRRTMRVSWTVGKESQVVYDTGVANLLKEESPVLIHFDKEHTQQWTLVRLKNPNLPGSSPGKK